jgi:hypothetical protein
MDRQKMQRVITALALAAGGILVGANLTTTRIANAEIRPAPEAPAFQTGDQMSLPILREMSLTLRQIDGRLARLETVAQKVQMTQARSAVRSATPGTVDETEAAQ